MRSLYRVTRPIRRGEHAVGANPVACAGRASRRLAFRILRLISNGGSAGARTQDQYLKRVLLYQLSYRPGRLRGGGMVLLEIRNVHPLAYARLLIRSRIQNPRSLKAGTA